MEQGYFTMRNTLTAPGEDKRPPWWSVLVGTKWTLMLAAAFLVAGLGTMLNPPQVAQRVTVLAPDGAAGADGYTDDLIAQLQERAKADPSNSVNYSQLGVAYLQKTRETNDPAFYAQAEESFKRALEVNAADYDALAGMGSLELSRHRFDVALEWGRKARDLKPASAFAYGVMGDALVELGRYPEAFEMFQQMVNLRPDLASYSRVSYARELQGDVEGAIENMSLAVSAGGSFSENTAWSRVQLGNLYLNSNRLDEAEAAYNEALLGYPDYLHAQAALGQVRWARGDLDGAIELYREATSSVPLPHYVATLGDLLALKGDEKGAQEQYDLALFIYGTQERGGVDVDIEKALFMADRGIQPEERAAQKRQDVNTLDALAWSLHRAGRHAEAGAEMAKALRLGTQYPTFFYHMGSIQRALGDEAKAREYTGKALAANPYFSPLHAEEARKFMEAGR
jgi:tetratricopeptide (TPR) repeat protein